MSDPVFLDIGGVSFKTTKDTISKFDGKMKKMAMTRGIFINREPKHFRLILNFLRDGDVTLPDSEQEIREIQKEAEFYELKELEEKCRGRTKLNIIGSYEDLLQIITAPVKPVFIFYYPVKNDGVIRHPDGFDVMKFQEDFKSKIDIYFKTFKAEDGSTWNWAIYMSNFSMKSGYEERRGDFRRQVEHTIKQFLSC